MKHGDFTDLAKYYVNRPGYARTVLDVLQAYAKSLAGCQDIAVADVGAGTGKLTENLIELGLHGYAVEPNDAMRSEGVSYIQAVQGLTPPPHVIVCGSRRSYGLRARLSIRGLMANPLIGC